MKKYSNNKLLQYKALIFDLDGTLLDTTEGVLFAVKETVKKLGLPVKSNTILGSFVGPPMQFSFQKHYSMEPAQALQAANLFRQLYRQHSLFRAVLYSDVKETLDILLHQGYQIAVATNKSHENAMAILQHFGIMEYCSYAKGSDLQGKLTKADIIRDCCANLFLQSEECIYIGDSIFDLKGAEQCNMDFIAVTYGFGFQKQNKPQSDRLISCIDSFREILQVL